MKPGAKTLVGTPVCPGRSFIQPSEQQAQGASLSWTLLRPLEVRVFCRQTRHGAALSLMLRAGGLKVRRPIRWLVVGDAADRPNVKSDERRLPIALT